MRPALAQICTLNAPFGLDLSDYAAAQCPAIEIWLTKLEEFLRTYSIADVRRRLDEHQLVIAAASQQGGLLASQGEARREAWQLFQQRLQLVSELGGRTIVVSCDIPSPVSQQDLDRVQVSLHEAAEAGRKLGVRVAIEFQSRAAVGNNLQTAAALVAEVAHPFLGLCLDAFHYYVGPSKPDDLGLLTRDNLFHVQLCDLADVPREFAADANRILPGEGDIPLQPVLARLEEIGYDGFISVELMNPQVWQIPPRQFSEIAMTALRKLLGQARME
jgi:4-hydroxyphenylpyruvate dioxygenase